uniref:Uncharacterized protein n=1 Tax=Anguilla anguilla TaxID=7936 RepID=A0A0E9S1U8_ANGAN
MVNVCTFLRHIMIIRFTAVYYIELS